MKIVLVFVSLVPACQSRRTSFGQQANESVSYSYYVFQISVIPPFFGPTALTLGFITDFDMLSVHLFG